MTQVVNFKDLKAHLGLKHNDKEGGFLSLTYNAKLSLPNNLFPDLPQANPERTLGGAIYYVITEHSPSRMHRTMADVIYHFYSGDPVEILLVYPSGHKPASEIITFGADLSAGQLPMKTIPGGTWMGSRVHDGGTIAIMGVTMAPGFHSIDYQIANIDEFKADHPQYAEFVDKLYERQSFYIFDIDENMLSLPTKIILFPKDDKGKSIEITQEEHDVEKDNIQKKGKFQDYKIISSRSYRFFNDITDEERKSGLREHFLEDIEEAFQDGTFKGPSWGVFSYAVQNQRPMAIVTARGHSQGVIHAGLLRLVELGAIPNMPNLLEVQCVNNPDMKEALEVQATEEEKSKGKINSCLLYTSPSPRD